MTDDSDTQPVWIVTGTNGTSAVYHTERDCRNLKEAEHTVRELTRDAAEARWRRPCQTCATIPSKPEADAEVTCPHCGEPFSSLGRHIPCDDAETPDTDDRVRGGASL